MRALLFLVMAGLLLGPAYGAEKGGEPAMPAGLILVAKVGGDPRLTRDGHETRIKVDDQVPAKATLTTQANEMIALVFSNGTVVQIAANSTVVVEEFLQAPFSGTLKVSELVVEPSKSQTRLRLVRGELVCAVKKLALRQGSSFVVETPRGLIEADRNDSRSGAGVFKVQSRLNDANQPMVEVMTTAGSYKLAPPTRRLSL